MTDPVVIASAISGAVGLVGTGATIWLAKNANQKLKTSNGKTVAQHVEDLVLWSHIHTEQDNEIRDALGIRRAEYPDLVKWRNEA